MSANKVVSGNEEMAAAWDGPEGDHWAEHADRYEATSERYGQLLLEAAGLREDSRGPRHRLRDGSDDRGRAAGSPPAGPCSGSTCRRGCSPSDGPRPRSSNSTTCDSSRPTPRCTRSTPAPTTSPSARSARCSSPIRSRPSPTSGARCDPARGSRSPAGASSLATSGSTRSAPRSPPDATSRPRRRGCRARSAWPTRRSRRSDSEPPATTTSTSGRSKSRCASARTPTTPTRSSRRSASPAGSPHDLDDATKTATLERLHQTLADHETTDGVVFASSAWLITAANRGEAG